MNELLGIGRLKFDEGRLEEFKRLSVQAMEVVRTMDTGTLQFDVYLNDDESQCIIVERYKDSAALMEHGSHIGHLMGPIFATGSASSDMLGQPNAELRAMMTDGPVRLFTPFLSLTGVEGV
jgi:quinol monooxygenase YgiN